MMLLYYQQHYTFKPDETLEYLRKSRSDEPNLTVEEVLEKHSRILSDWAEKNLDGPIPEENIYREVVSGETLDGRPEALKMLKRIESPKIKAILCVEPQRLSRGDLEDCGRLIKLLRYTSTKVITPVKIYDLENDFDREAFERELKRGNDYLEYYKTIQKRGKMAAIEDGCFIANKPPYGYKKLVLKEGKRNIHTLEIDEEKAQIVRMIFDLHVNQNIGLGNIATKLNQMAIPSPSGNHWTYNGLRDLVANEHYVGKIRWDYNKTEHIVEGMEIHTARLKNKEYLLFDGRHEAIIDEDTFYKCYGKRKQGKPRIKSDLELKNPLSGLVFCKKCGHAVTLKPRSLRNAEPRYMCNRQHICGCGSVQADYVLKEVANTLRENIENFEAEMSLNDKQAIKRQTDTIALLERRLQELEDKEISLWEKYSEEDMPKAIFEKLKEKVLADKKAVTLSLVEERNNVIVVNYEERIATFKAALDALLDDTVSAEEKNKLLKLCIERITYYRDKSTRLKKSSEETNVRGWMQAPVELHFKLNI